MSKKKDPPTEEREKKGGVDMTKFANFKFLGSIRGMKR